MAVRPAGTHAWSSEIGNHSTATLSTLPLNPVSPIRVRFDAFIDTEAGDALVLESSTDAVTWHPVALRTSGVGAPEAQVRALTGHGHRSWWQVAAELPAAGPVVLRWRYSTDASYTGRGVYVDGVRITTNDGILLDSEQDPSLLRATGWTLKNR
jgi:hypothetical protein